ncbi:hypothetical protein [Parasphingorhabdus pacifica]
MDHDELVRKYHTPREQLDPETRAKFDRQDAERAAKRERGEYVPESLMQRHLSETPLPPEGSPADLARREARAAPEAREDNGEDQE